MKNQLEKNLEALPNLCAVMVDKQPAIIKRGESGYYPTDFLHTEEDVKNFNEKLGVTPAQALAMEAGSMFGWQVPGAHPSAWEK